MEKIILITGASSGIGKATAEQLVAAGHTVYGLARRKAKLQEVSGLIPIVGDMTDEASLERAVKEIIDNHQQIDVLINNAGYGLYGPVEEIGIEHARNQFDVNLFGLAYVTQLVIPHMRQAGSGKIINISSMGGRMYTPFGAWYHATKYALEGWSDCLRLELKQFGIKVVIVEPGAIQTAWGDTAGDNLRQFTDGTPYETYARKVSKRTLDGYQGDSLSPPTVVAKAIERATKAKRPKTRYVTGRFARLLIFIRKYLGDRVFDALFQVGLR